MMLLDSSAMDRPAAGGLLSGLAALGSGAGG